MSGIRLIVQGDDFGMCHAVNTAILRAFQDGILTQASVMAPCPWFMEAAQLAVEHNIPVGLHCTLTCDWELMRWRPLTAGSSLVDEEGNFHRTVAAAAKAVDRLEAREELAAQAQRMIAVGLHPVFFDMHMGSVCREAYAHVCEIFDRPFLYAFVEPHVAFDSIGPLSERKAGKKRAWMLEHLASLTPGTHFIQTHPGTASAELRSLERPGSPIEEWAEEYRVSDLEVLTDPEVLAVVADREIELISIADL